jgi:hypothetical protein
MCSEPLVELCAHEFELFVDALFWKNRASGDELCRAPIIERLYFVQDDAYIAKLKRLVHAAVAARKWFREHAPPWAPTLPLSFAEIHAMERDESNRVNLVVLYASSLMMLEWDYQTHPPFTAYARGLMAYAQTPNYLRDDPGLRQEFPPKPLAGIDAGFNWQTPEMIAQHLAVHEEAIQRFRDQNASAATLQMWIDERDSYFGTISTS